MLISPSGRALVVFDMLPLVQTPVQKNVKHRKLLYDNVLQNIEQTTLAGLSTIRCRILRSIGIFRAYQRPTHEEVKRDLKAIRTELDELNQSAVASLDEGFEETLTLHRLGVFPLVGRSLKTTNVIESVNAMAEQRCGRVDHWKDSSQKQRWFAAALLDIESRLRKLSGYRHLPLLRAAIQKELGIHSPDRIISTAA